MESTKSRNLSPTSFFFLKHMPHISWTSTDQQTQLFPSKLPSYALQSPNLHWKYPHPPLNHTCTYHSRTSLNITHTQTSSTHMYHISPQLKPVPTNSPYVPTITNAPLQLLLILLIHTWPFNMPISYKNHSTSNTDFAPTLPRCLTQNTISPITFYHNPYTQRNHKLDSCSSNPINPSSSPLLILPPSPASICIFLPTSFTLIQIHCYHLISWLLSLYAPTSSHWCHSHLYAHSCLSHPKPTHAHATILISHLPHTSHPSHHETSIPPSPNKPFHNLSNKLPP